MIEELRPKSVREFKHTIFKEKWHCLSDTRVKELLVDVLSIEKERKREDEILTKICLEFGFRGSGRVGEILFGGTG